MRQKSGDYGEQERKEGEGNTQVTTEPVPQRKARSFFRSNDNLRIDFNLVLSLNTI